MHQQFPLYRSFDYRVFAQVLEMVRVLEDNDEGHNNDTVCHQCTCPNAKFFVSQTRSHLQAKVKREVMTSLTGYGLLCVIVQYMLV